MIKPIPPFERPRERCLTIGPSCLSLRECLALILGSGPPKKGCLGVASDILQHPGEGLSSEDEETAFFTAMEISGNSYLKNLPSLGSAGRAKILAAFELGRRYALHRSQKHRERPPRSSTLLPISLQALLRISQKDRSEPQEWFGFIPYHRSGELGGLCLVERGARTHVNVDPTELFARILVLRPRGIILFHNHPSGNVTPSEQDIELTEQVALTAKQFGIQLLGHWIVSPETERSIP